LDVIDLDEQGMQTLGGLPELCHLGLSTKSTVTVTKIATDGNNFFQKLRSCKFSSSMVLLVLNEDSSVSFTLWNARGDMLFDPRKKKDERTRGAPATVMPSLQELSFEAQWSWPMVQSQGRFFSNLGLEHLISLQKVTATADCEGYHCEEDVTAAEAALRQATDVHPNHPALVFNRINEKSVRQKWKNETKSRRTWARRTGTYPLSHGLLYIQG
jgi:disease resistance protein RPM1